MSSSKNNNPIPNRWLHCPRKSLGFIADKFLAFKTPLSSKFDSQVPPECQFTPQMLLQTKTYKGRIGLWVDLTNTSRFYNKDDVEAENIKYLKLQCRGHGEAPSVEQTDIFVSVVHQFISQNPLKIVAVHCTHGFNRSGFLIVSYLVEKMDCSLESALAQFKQFRPPGIYKGDYLEELYRRYDDVEDTPPPPELPGWCKEYDDGDDDIDSSKSSGHGKRRKEFQNKNPVFMEGVSGVEVFKEQPKVFNLQRKIQKMCGWKSKGFPGSQPVSMDTHNIQLLQDKPYRVSWKADGTRYMMLIDKENEIYFFDRDNSVFKVEGIKFLHRKDPRRHLVNTLVDGEMVIDRVNGTAIPRYLVYDVIKFEGQDVYKSPFYPTRLQCIQHEIIQPRHLAIREGRIDKNREPFSIRQKEFWDVTQAANLLGDKFSKMLSHEPDGLIFQPSKEPYIPGRCDEVLKWKPLSLNTVDFKLKIVNEGGEGILPRKVGQLYVGQLDIPFTQMKVTKAIKELDGKIIECKYENNQWVFMRERVDKSFPNGYNTAFAVCNTIKDPVTKEKLLEFIENHRYFDDQEIMPPPPKLPRKH